MGRRREEGLTQVVQLVSGGNQKSSHADRQQIGAVAAPYGHRLKQTAARNAHGEDGVAKGAVDVAELLGARREVVQRQGC